MQRPTIEPSGYDFGKPAKASPADARRSNRALIFSLLFPNRQYSRAQLGRLTGLSRVATSDVVNAMLDEGLIWETGPDRRPPTGKGKRGTMLSVNTDRHRIISISLAQTQLIRGAITDLLGHPIDHAEATVPHGRATTVDDIAKVIETLLERTDHAIGIGVAATGIIDENGTVRISAGLGWRDVELASALERRFALPTTVSNDATAALMTERFFGQGGGNLMFVHLHHGVGAALLVNDALVTGESRAAGEIGHITVDMQGPPCPCGKQGCLEQLIAAPHIRRRMQDADDAEADAIIGEAARLLGQALAMPIGMLDMSDVCVYGPADIVNDTFLHSLQLHLDATTDAAWRRRTTVRRCRCDGDIVLRGEAIAVAYNHVNSL